ncbi:hypothetical protein MVEN_01365600 [Mycena venus]|uniref:Ricin B lectin domain-containing protein n=1 Tax=Mycena venus TaxID=2733690 RepID=A0A8H6XWL3_9AGAR|nr:hypothetical protein MVEN_01365600 [Mycena venus]
MLVSTLFTVLAAGIAIAVPLDRRDVKLDAAATAEAQKFDATATRAFTATTITTSDGKCLSVDPFSGDFRENLTPINVATCDGSKNQTWDVITAGVHNNVKGQALIVSSLTNACLNFDARRAPGNQVLLFSCGGRADGGGQVTDSQLFAFTGGAGPQALVPQSGKNAVCLTVKGNVIDQTACNGAASATGAELFTFGGKAAGNAAVASASASSAAASSVVTSAAVAIASPAAECPAPVTITVTADAAAATTAAASSGNGAASSSGNGNGSSSTGKGSSSTGNGSSSTNKGSSSSNGNGSSSNGNGSSSNGNGSSSNGKGSSTGNSSSSNGKGSSSNGAGSSNNNGKGSAATTAKGASTTTAAASTSNGKGSTGSTGNGKGAAGTTAVSSTAAAASASSTVLAAAPPPATASDPQALQSSTTIDPSVLQTTDDGQNPPVDGQTAADVSKNNFANLCALGLPKVPITNGLQITTGSCNPIPIGNIPSVDNMPSSKFQNPKNFDTIASNQTFTVLLATKGIQLGTFTNAQKTYFGNPQKLNAQGQIIGHTHIVMEAIDSITTTTLTNPKNFFFFKGINTAQDAQGNVQVDVTGGVGPGVYRMCTIVSSATHQPAIVPVAQHGSLDDCIYFTATPGGAAAAGNGAAAGNAAAAGGAAAGNGAAAAGNGADAGKGAGAGKGAASTTNVAVVSASSSAAVVAASSAAVAASSVVAASSAVAATTTAKAATTTAATATAPIKVSGAGGTLNPTAVAESQKRDDSAATRAATGVQIKSSDGQCLSVDPTAGDFRENLIPIAVKACDGSAGQKFDFITKGVHNNQAGQTLIVSSLTNGCFNFDDRRAAGDQVIMFSCGGRADGTGQVATSQLFPFVAADLKAPYALTPSNAKGVCFVNNNGRLSNVACDTTKPAANQLFTIVA